MRSLLILGAHPDDETFFAGTMAKCVEEGLKVSIVCGTRGERGATADLCSIEDLPRVREAELREAMRILGVADITFLPYEDQKLSKAPLDDVRRQLVAVVRRVRPQVVVTFDPNGANGHTDHLAMSRFGADAIAASADPRWYSELGPHHVVDRLLWQPPSLKLLLGQAANLPEQAGIDFLIDTARQWHKKEAAIRAYRTQLPGLEKLFFEGRNVQHAFSVEGFRLAWGRRPARVPADDLFA